MGAYEKFAQVYDLFMDNIDYEGWADYVTDRLKRIWDYRMVWYWNLDVAPEQ